MKKIALALLVVAFAATAASAAVNIQWTAIYGAYDHDAPNTTDYLTPADEATALLNNYSVTWQLIYAGVNDVADDIDLSNSANGWVSGDDDVWATRTLAESVGGADVTASDGSIWGQWMTWQFGGNNDLYGDAGWSTAGYVFQRVFEGSPAELSYFYQTPEEAIEIDPAISTLFTVDTGASGFQPDQQIPAAVPEPATMALLGLGALTMAIRRRRK